MTMGPPGRKARMRWVVKVGGSLAKAGALTGALSVIGRLSGQGFKIAVCPGGGDYADFIRRHGGANKLPDHVTHHQAILSIHQFGYELAWRLPKAAAVSTIKGAMIALDKGAIPVFLPGASLIADAPQGWDSTSDAMAAALCRSLRFGGLALLKCVDGVMAEGRLLARATAAQAAGAGVVDPSFGRILGDNWDVFILNGRKPQRLEELLIDGAAKGTRITAR